MRILLLADSASEHTQKWALGLAALGLEIGVFSFNHSSLEWCKDVKNIKILFRPDKDVNSASLFTKLSYLKYTRKLKRIIADYKPDVLHAHYATSYGLVGRLSGFHPFVISAWGTDVMRFPQKNRFNRKMLQANFEMADIICATSGTIESYVKQITEKKVQIIPFGVDTNRFYNKGARSNSKDKIVIGCVKSLEKIYRIDVLIEAFGLLKKDLPTKKLELLIVGGGTQEMELKTLCKTLNLSEDVEFTGKIDHNEVVDAFNRIDIFANLSEYESFGVSVVEAMACECAVVVTDVGGLKEIVCSEEIGSRVLVGDKDATKAAIKEFVLDDSKRKSIAEAGRKWVLNHYCWEDNIEAMYEVYKRLTTQ